MLLFTSSFEIAIDVVMMLSSVWGITNACHILANKLSLAKEKKSIHWSINQTTKRWAAGSQNTRL